MNIVRMIMLLLERFVPVESNDLKKMWNGGDEWYSKTEGKEDGTIGEKIKHYASQWWGMAIVAILYMIFYRTIIDFMNPKSEEPETEDDGFSFFK